MSWHGLQDADASFLECAPEIHRYATELPVAPATVWASLASDESLAAWSMDLGLSLRVHWTSPRPFGVGATRDVRLPMGLITLRERFFRWDEGRGYSFCAVAANRRGLRRFAEDHRLEPRPGGALFTWTVAIEPSVRALRAAAPLNRVGFGRTAAAARRYFRNLEEETA